MSWKLHLRWPRRRCGSNIGRLLYLFAITIIGPACSPPQVRTTFLNSVDLVEMTDEMTESLLADETIGRRDRNSKPWIISVDRIVNRTNQIIPEREKWLYIARLRGRLAQTPIAENRNLIWIIPPERWPQVARELDAPEEPYGLRLDPTHVLTGEFYALTNSSSLGRADSYLCNFQLLDLNTGNLIWEDKWEVKRAIAGLPYD